MRLVGEAVSPLTQEWLITIRTDAFWLALSLVAALALLLGPALTINTLWLVRLRRSARSLAGFAALADALPSGVVVLAPDGKVAFLNSAAATLWPGLAPGEPLPAQLARLIDSDGARVSATVASPGGPLLAAHCRPLPTDSGRWPLRRAGGRGRETVLLLEDAGRRQEESAFADALMRQLSHELKTPLSVIRGHASRFADSIVADPAETQRAWAVVDDEASRLTGMIDQAILMARFESPDPLFEPRPLNLRAVCEEVVIDLADRAAEAGGELELEVDEGRHNLRGDRAALRQLLINLVENALKYAGPRPRITIELAELADLDKIRLAVRDDGPGIAPDELPLIFEKGFRGAGSRGSRAGSGLGLALVRAIAERHGGSVAAESTPGTGTCIALTFPTLRETRDPLDATTRSLAPLERAGD